MSKTVAFVPVRGGSKSIPGKNIKSFCGRPLVYWVLNELNKSVSIDEVILATDSLEIKNVVESFKFSKVIIYDRDKLNADDFSSTESVMLEYFNYQKNLHDEDTFILVQATSPFTQASDFESALHEMKASQSESLLSCARTKRFFWNKEGTPINYDYNNRPRRQDFDGELLENGAFYINKVGNIKKSKNRLSGKICVYEMPEYTVVEIDEIEDWIVAESIMKKIQLPVEKCKIKLFLTDVDGVLTDAGMYYSAAGDEMKKFNTKDGKGIELLRNAGVKTGIITSENTQIVSNRAKKLKVDYLYQGAVSNKLDLIKEICKEENIGLENVAYIGDDINDYEALSHVGLKACPNDAVQSTKEINDIIILETKGGSGAVREYAELILKLINDKENI
jgi:YrbI family 3-deoxy-D-manno-octulosonate 8-phosphate phosphatase